MFGRSPSFEKSLFTDTEPDTCEPDLSLMTQREKKQFNNRSSSVFDNGTNSLYSLHRRNADEAFAQSTVNLYFLIKKKIKKINVPITIF